MSMLTTGIGSDSAGSFARLSANATAAWDSMYEYPTLVDGAVSDLPDIISTNNAQQSTAANRPVLSRADNRENRIGYSEALDNAVWGKTRGTIEVGDTVISNGVTLQFFKEDSTAANTHIVGSNSGVAFFNTASGTTYRFKFRIKSSNRGVALRPQVGFAGAFTYFDPVNGTVVSVGAGVTNATITALDNGTYQCSMDYAANATATNAVLNFYLTNPSTGTTTSYNGDNVSGAYIGAIQVQVLTADATYVATTTYPQYSGINGNAVPVFDSSNDSLATTIAVNPTGGMWGAVVVRANALSTQILLAARKATVADRRFQIFYISTGVISFQMIDSSGNLIQRDTAAGAIVAGQTAVFSFTYDGTNLASGIKIYRNGTQIDTTSVTSGVYAVSGVGETLEIGANNGGGGSWFNGYLSPAVFGQGSTWADADRQATEQALMQKYIPNYVWFNPANNVTSDAGAVASWTDVTNTYVASQSTAANRPTVSTLNGQTAFLYDGTNDSLATSLAVNPTGGMAGVVVVKASVAHDGTYINARLNLAASRLFFGVTSAGTIIARVFSSNTDRIGRTSAASAITTDLAVLSFTYDGGTAASGIKIYKNGVQIDTTDSNAGTYAVPTAGDVLVIGSANAADRFNGYIADAFFVQGRQMSDSERQGWESRFMTQYGVV